MAVERYICAAGLGLAIMFVAEITIFFNFLVISPEVDTTIPLEPAPKLLQFISIGIVPSGIMYGISFILSRRYGSRPIGTMMVAGGAILIAGMAFASVQSQDIPEEHRVDAVILTPYVSMAAGAAIIGVGSRLFRIRKRPRFRLTDE